VSRCRPALCECEDPPTRAHTHTHTHTRKHTHKHARTHTHTHTTSRPVVFFLRWLFDGPGPTSPSCPATLFQAGVMSMGFLFIKPSILVPPEAWRLSMLKNLAAVMGDIDASQAAVKLQVSHKKVITYIVLGAHTSCGVNFSYKFNNRVFHTQHSTVITNEFISPLTTMTILTTILPTHLPILQPTHHTATTTRQPPSPPPTPPSPPPLRSKTQSNAHYGDRNLAQTIT